MGEGARFALEQFFHDELNGVAVVLPQPEPARRQRLDKWLWHARVVKARNAAADLVESGRVRINGERQTSPGHGVKIGDVLTVSLDRTIRLMRVKDFAERRGDADAARLLYDDVQSTPEA